MGMFPALVSSYTLLASWKLASNVEILLWLLIKTQLYKYIHKVSYSHKELLTLLFKLSQGEECLYTFLRKFGTLNLPNGSITNAKNAFERYHA